MSFREILFHDVIAYLLAILIVVFSVPIALRITAVVEDWINRHWPT